MTSLINAVCWAVVTGLILVRFPDMPHVLYVATYVVYIAAICFILYRIFRRPAIWFFWRVLVPVLGLTWKVGGLLVLALLIMMDPKGARGSFGDITYVYYFYDVDGNLLYVGITNNIQRRWEQHAEEKPWWHLVARKEYVRYYTREEAERVEEHQIRTQRPQFNRAMNGWLSR